MIEFTRVKREIVTMVDYYNAHISLFAILKYQNFTVFLYILFEEEFYCVALLLNKMISHHKKADNFSKVVTFKHS